MSSLRVLTQLPSAAVAPPPAAGAHPAMRGGGGSGVGAGEGPSVAAAQQVRRRPLGPPALHRGSHAAACRRVTKLILPTPPMALKGKEEKGEGS